jgi:ATP-dependent phosphoenolpyruvate carboxykinase
MKTVRRSHVTATEAKLVVPIDGSRVSKNLTAAGFLERALARGEGQLAENGAFVVNTAPCTGRIPNDKFLERTAATEASIAWGKVNKPISPEVFDELIGRVNKHLEELEEVFIFEGFAGADAKYRLNVRVASEYAWHALFARTLFIRPTAEEHAGFTADWTVVTTSLEVEDFSDLGLNSEHTVIQSLDRKIVVVLGSKYAGEMKKSIFYAMNYDMPDRASSRCTARRTSTSRTRPTSPSSSGSAAPARRPSRRTRTDPHRRRRARLGPRRRLQLRGRVLRQVHQAHPGGRAPDLQRHPFRQRPRETSSIEDPRPRLR